MLFKPGDRVRILNAHPLDIFNPPSSGVIVHQIEGKRYYLVEIKKDVMTAVVHEHDMLLDDDYSQNDRIMSTLWTILAVTFVILLLYWTIK